MSPLSAALHNPNLSRSRFPVETSMLGPWACRSLDATAIPVDGVDKWSGRSLDATAIPVDGVDKWAGRSLDVTRLSANGLALVE